VQESDLTAEQRRITEVNLGAYVFDAAFLREQLPHLQPHLPKGEFYLTDLIEVAARQGRGVDAVTIEGGAEIMGINTLEHLEHATRVIYRRTNRRLMAGGVTIIDSATTFIDEEVEIEPDTIILPFTMIRGATRIGRDCEIGPGSHILSAVVGERCRVLSSTVRDSEIGNDVSVGPYAHVRGGARIGDKVRIGTGSEIKGSRVGDGSTMMHFGYVGDAQVGTGVNIAAGVVTCNYDGKAKHRTVIGDGAFIGSDTMLRAPITIGDGAYTGAGSVVTKDVLPGVTVAGIPARAVPRRKREVEPGT
jgi:bifunctional UDP-N-acetylglucosamine pyrophosphorylase/glucosamine-1-phosphate N-acetyltransferase